jgi:anti-sigma B factor antagonist
MPKSRRQHIQVRDDGGATRITFAEPILDEQNREAVADQILAVIEESAEPHLTLDFEPVLFVSSAGLSALIQLQQHIHARGGTLRLCNLRPDVYQVFEATGLGQILDVHAGPLP